MIQMYSLYIKRIETKSNTLSRLMIELSMKDLKAL